MFAKSKRFQPPGALAKNQSAATKKSDPETTEPKTIDPETTKPKTKDPETAKPKTKDPETTKPKTKDPEITKPKTKDPETTKPKTKDSETTKPKTKDSEITKPKTKDAETTKPKTKVLPPPLKLAIPKETKVYSKAKLLPVSTPIKTSWDTQSKESSIKSTKSFVTPRPVKSTPKPPTSLRKEPISSKIPTTGTVKSTKALKNIKASKSVQEEIVKAQEVEIRNKDVTIEEYNKQIEELKNYIATLNKKLDRVEKSNDVENLGEKLSEINLEEENSNLKTGNNLAAKIFNDQLIINELQQKILVLEQQCEQLEQEVSGKQVDLQSLEVIITIRDSLCKDLQDKLTNMETTLEETKQRLEMVKGHHALALEANESIRREYKAELETLKSKFEDEKLVIVTKSKIDQENLKLKYTSLIDSIKEKNTKEKDEAVNELELQLATKEHEMRAKIEQINEATEEKLRLCEIQFEERSRSIQEHWTHQEQQIKYLENETKDLTRSLNMTEELNMKLKTEINYLKKEIEDLKVEKSNLVTETDELKEEAKKKLIDFENEINKLTVKVDTAVKEKKKFEMSLSVTRDIVQVLTLRLRESDTELEHLEGQVSSLTESKDKLESELNSLKTTLKNTVSECDEYKEALVNILKSKAALAKEHNRIMEHNVTLIESLQNVEKEAYRELGSIKNEMIEDVEILKKESKSQIQMLRDEVEQKRVLCVMATEHAGQATEAAEQSRLLLATAAAEIERLEADNRRLQQQIQDQQSLVVELSLLRQENEELSMTVAKQTSMVDKMRKEVDHAQIKPKSPSVMRKHKGGKENLQVTVSPLRERNH